MSSPLPSKSPRGLRVALAGSVVVMIAAGALFYYAAQSASAKREANRGHEVTVDILAHGCEPNALTVPAGAAAFRIQNKSDRAVEWEILNGVLVIEERENITPGMSQVIKANLAPGDYAITCGLLSNPRGTLHVTPTAESEAKAKAQPQLVAFVGPLSEYRVWLAGQSRQLIKALQALQQAIAAGDLDQARAAYAPVRQVYGRLAPVARRFAALDNALDARADAFAQREQDAGFVGLHRLEYALFESRSLKNLDPVAERAVADATQLREQMLAQSLPPDQWVAGAAQSMHDISGARGQGQEERYSHLDLVDFQANLDGVRKVTDLLKPILSVRDGELQRRLDTQQDALQQALDAVAAQPSYANLAPDARQRIEDAARDLAAALDDVDPALGLSDL